MTTAATISVRQTLELLDGPFAELAEGVGQKRYALWLGSGISWERVAGLGDVIKRVLEHLRNNANPADTNCKFSKALDEALSFAQLSLVEKGEIDVSRTVDEWAILPTIIERLSDKYADLIDVRIEGEKPDHLLWDIINVPGTFATASPDCEHLCIGILAIEGVVSDIVSSNWDGLIETAALELNGGAGGVLQVCVLAEDLRAAPLRAKLIKMHGCAVRAAEDPAKFRVLLIARRSQITSWPYDQSWAPIRDYIKNLAVTRPTLMIGLSARDNNIQDVFAAAQATMQWVWPSHPPANVSAEEALGSAQRNILRCVYREAYDDGTADIEAGATLQAYGKPLLSALVLHVLCSKFGEFARVADAPGLDDSARSALSSGIIHLRNRVADGAASMGYLDFVSSLVHASSRAMSLFQEGRLLPAGKPSYRALSSASVSQIAAEPNLPTSGLREMAVGVGLLGLGESGGDWTIELGDLADDHDGVVRAATPGTKSVTRLFFAANSNAALYLETGNIVRRDDGDALVLHSAAPVRQMPRSPRAAPGRTGRRVARNVDMAAMLRDATDLDNLRERSRVEASL